MRASPEWLGLDPLPKQRCRVQKWRDGWKSGTGVLAAWQGRRVGKDSQIMALCLENEQSPPGLAVSFLLAREMQRRRRGGCGHLFSQDVIYLLHVLLQMLSISQVFDKITLQKNLCIYPLPYHLQP